MHLKLTNLKKNKALILLNNFELNEISGMFMLILFCWLFLKYKTLNEKLKNFGYNVIILHTIEVILCINFCVFLLFLNGEDLGDTLDHQK